MRTAVHTPDREASGETNLLTPGARTSSLQEHEERSFCCSGSVLWVWKPEQARAQTFIPCVISVGPTNGWTVLPISDKETEALSGLGAGPVSLWLWGTGTQGRGFWLPVQLPRGEKLGK